MLKYIDGKYVLIDDITGEELDLLTRRPKKQIEKPEKTHQRKQPDAD